MNNINKENLFVNFLESKFKKIKLDIDNVLDEISIYLSNLFKDINSINYINNKRYCEEENNQYQNQLYNKNDKLLDNKINNQSDQICNFNFNIKSIKREDNYDESKNENDNLINLRFDEKSCFKKNDKINTSDQSEKIKITTNNIKSDQQHIKLKLTNSKNNFLSYLKHVNNYDFEPSDMKQISYRKDKKMQRFQRRTNNENIDKEFRPMNTNLETNLFILNEIQKKQLIYLDVDNCEYQKFLDEINDKYKYLQ